MDIILTHENADFDAVAGLLATARLHPNYTPVISTRLNQNVARFLALYGGAFPFVSQEHLRARMINRVILVDTQRLPRIKHMRADIEVQIIDHHEAGEELQQNYVFTYEAVGSVTTYLVEQLQLKSIEITSIEATLLMLGIYEDTGSLSYGTTTPRDLHAAAWLLAQQSDLDTVRRFLSHPLNPEQQNLLETLMKHVENRSVEGYSVSLSAVSVPELVSEVSAVVHRMRDLFEFAALFVVVEMPGTTLLVARSVVDGIDVGIIARLLGGGGHGRASAATIRGKSLDQIRTQIWQELKSVVTPIARVAELMSYGVQTVEAGLVLRDVIRRVRQIGHEGYPVVESGQVVGLLTRRDLDRADEHQLRELRVRDVMTSGRVTVTRDTSVFELERLLLESGWGQIPVVSENEQLIGIVTRTDLLKYWARVHPSSAGSGRLVTLQQIKAMLGQDITSVIQLVSEQAQTATLEVYLVGGVVRDLLLGRANFDVDFVVEGDAIEFAKTIQILHGGDVVTFKPFGTAKWKPKEVDQFASGSLNHIDFASARYEFYEHPTALPTVYNSSIKLDLQRRDFTINTLAIQLSPTSSFGRIIDFYGGLKDLDSKLIRVLHSLSFIDDPTRILRAIRFAHRLGFQVEARTDELMTTALAMLSRITGERLRNELTLLLNENEPEVGLMKLQDRGILEAIHPLFHMNQNAAQAFRRVRDVRPNSFTSFDDVPNIYWHIWAASTRPESVAAICDRLLFGKKLTESMLHASKLARQRDEFLELNLRPSAIVARLEGISELALIGFWYGVDNREIQGQVELYWQMWRHQQPIANGDTLSKKGLKPGPCYSVILRRLRDAWLDGAVQNKAEEDALVDRLILDESICDGDT